MGDKITLTLEKRELHGKKVAKLRREGLTPGVIYGGDLEPAAVQGNAQEVAKVVARAGKHTPVHLPGFKRSIAMIKSVDYDPTRHGRIRHVSFHAIKANEKVTAEVPIRLAGMGESQAEKAGLIILQSLDKVEVKALPANLPEALELSIVEMHESGDRVTVGDIALPDGVELVEHDTGRVEEGDDEDAEKPSVNDLVVATVYEPSALAAANEAAAGDATNESEVEAENGAEEAAVNDGESPESSAEKAE